MAFDQNSLPLDLRPINVARTVAEEPRIVPVTATGRIPDGYFCNPSREVVSPNSAPVIYPGTISEAEYVGLRYENMASGVAAWCPRVSASVGHSSMSPAVGFAYTAPLGNRIVGVTTELASSGMATAVCTPNSKSPNLGNLMGGNGVDPSSCDIAGRFGYGQNLGNRVVGSFPDQTGNDPTTGFTCSPLLGNRTGSPLLGSRTGSNGADQASEEGGDDSVSGKKVKFLCSFGGKIFPRPCDGVLRYVGGHTRIISVRRDVTFNELMHKMMDAYGRHVVIKYQLPDEDLDALVSVSCPDDLDNMMEEYEKLVERAPDGSAKLRVFLFSASELDPSGTVQLGDLNDSGSRYVDAVNGIIDGGIGSLSRKESIASATSTQNSDFSGTEAVDSLGHSHGDVSGRHLIGMSSPKENLAVSRDSAPKLLCVDRNPSVYAEASVVPVGYPVIKSGPPQTTAQPVEAKLERSVPMAVPQQQGVEVSPPASYMPAYLDPRQEFVSHADYVHHPPQMGFPNAQVLTSGPMFTQQQFYDTIAPHQFIPAVHMTMNTSSPHVGIRPNVMQPLMHSQQTLLDNYVDERAFGPRIVQLPGEQSYNSYQVQVPPAVVGSGYGWHQVSPQEQVILSERLLPNQQVYFPEKILRLEDCYLCQKALPHTHSDTSERVQRDSCASSVSDSNSNYQSPRLEENVRAQPLTRLMVNGALGEGAFEPGNETRSRVIGHLDPQTENLQQELSRMLHNPELKHEAERISIQPQLADNIDDSRISASLGLNVRATGVQSPNGALLGSTPHSCPDKSVPQTLPAQFHVMPIQMSEDMLQQSPRERSDRLHNAIPKVDATDACISYDQLGAIGGRMENLRMHPTEVFNNNEHGKSPVDNLGMDNNVYHWIAQAGMREALLDKTSDKFEGNHFIPAEIMPHRSGQAEPYEVTQAPIWTHAVSHPQSQPPLPPIGTNEVHFNKPAFSGIDSTALIDRVVPPDEWKDNILRHNMIPITKMGPPDVETSLLNENIVSSLAPTNMTGNVQDSSNSIFSYQDPWNLHHDDAHISPAKPNKSPPKIESFATKDPFCENQLGNSGENNIDDYGVQQPLSSLNNNFSQEHFQSSKGSAEEQIKQELQAVAEGVAASVFQPAAHSNSDTQGRNEAANSFNWAANVENSSPNMQHNANAEDVKIKLPEKGSLGFPVSDSIGRLQIIKNSDLEELRELGSGTFGTVYHGNWRGTDVAIKRINDRCFSGKASEQERMRDDFWNEAIKLADLHHPNVLAFYGVVLDGPEGSVATVTEYMVNGSLRNALLKNEKSLDKRKRLLIGMDVAFGMEYLHGKNIVHFDLKSDNLLVNLRDPHRPICKVGDLGLSKVKCQTLISGGVRGTLPWMAPELLNGSSNLVSEKVDVFSFGIVLWELLTGEEPYADLHYGAIIGGIVSNTLRPPIPESCCPEWRYLMERCWSSEPLERPNFTEIANQLRAVAAKIPHKGQQQHPPQSP